MKLVSYTGGGQGTTFATDATMMECYFYLLRNWGNGFAVTQVHEITRDDLKRWQLFGGQVLLRSQMNGE